MLDAQATQIKTILAAVSNIGTVYEYHAVPDKDWVTFIASFTSLISGTRKVRAWTISCIDQKAKRTSIAIGATKIRHEVEWLIRGFSGWDDPTSDKEFRTLVEAVAAALEAKPSLNGTCTQHGGVSYHFPNDDGPIILGDVRCHLVEMRLVASLESTHATS